VAISEGELAVVKAKILKASCCPGDGAPPLQILDVADLSASRAGVR
jgi:hypothetical protein